jgi:hypothetical protein
MAGPFTFAGIGKALRTGGFTQLFLEWLLHMVLRDGSTRWKRAGSHGLQLPLAPVSVGGIGLLVQNAGVNRSSAL